MANDKKRKKGGVPAPGEHADDHGLAARPASGRGAGKGSLQVDETDDIGKDGRPGERGYGNRGTPNQGDRGSPAGNHPGKR